MKILLVGEYNRAHWNIKEGLKTLGHEAVTFAMQDGFKKVEVDIKIKNPFAAFILKKFKGLFYRLFKVDLLGSYVNYVISSKKEQLSNFDVIQFISEAPFTIDNKSQLKAFKRLIAWNKSVFILSSGKDYPSISYAYKEKLRYSILTPYFENKNLESNYKFALRYLKPDYKSYHDYIYSNSLGVIGCDLDYHIPLQSHTKYLGLVPHAIDLSQIKFNPPPLGDKIIIFHGINKSNYYMKGNFIFEEALSVIRSKYADKIEIIEVSNLPYKVYAQSIEKCHILLDQVYSYDLGFNALEAMAMGKVVFSGAEKEWQEHYNVKEDHVVINALPDVDYLVKKIEWLILNPEEITRISKNAIKHVETHHDHINCAIKYISIWEKNRGL